jgi:hypothetical protein
MQHSTRGRPAPCPPSPWPQPQPQRCRLIRLPPLLLSCLGSGCCCCCCALCSGPPLLLGAPQAALVRASLGSASSNRGAASLARGWVTPCCAVGSGGVSFVQLGEACAAGPRTLTQPVACRAAAHVPRMLRCGGPAARRQRGGVSAPQLGGQEWRRQAAVCWSGYLLDIRPAPAAPILRCTPAKHQRMPRTAEMSTSHAAELPRIHASSSPEARVAPSATLPAAPRLVCTAPAPPSLMVHALKAAAASSPGAPAWTSCWGT